MDTIRISKDVYKFLNSAIDSKHKSIHFRYFLATDFDKLITTNGYRMHIWPTDALQSNLVHPIMRLSYEDYQPVIMPIAKSGRYS